MKVCACWRRLYMVGRDTPEPNARGDRVRLAAASGGQRTENPPDLSVGSVKATRTRLSGACRAERCLSLSKCQRCIYRSPHPTKYGCDYLALMGSSRGCPPGDQCTVFEPGARLQVPIKTAIHSTSPEDRDYQEYYCDIVRKQGSPMAFRRRYG